MSDFFLRRKGRLEHFRLLRRRAADPNPLPVRDKQKTGQDTDITCPDCRESVSKEQVRSNHYICPRCGGYFPMPPEKRVHAVTDEGSFRAFAQPAVRCNPLDFPDYEEKKEALRKKTGQKEAVLAGVARIDGMPLVIACMNSRFLMGSMGVAVGESITRAAEYAGRHKLPLLIFTASGGARMQEGMMSLMQMAKTSAAIRAFQEKGGLYIACLTHPTTGGVSASFASLGDITLAEPGALIGFAGPRVIEQTIGEKLPEGFQRAEYLEKHGFVDQVVPRARLREILIRLLQLHAGRKS